MPFYQCPNCGQVYNESDIYYCFRCNIRLVKYEENNKVKHPELSNRDHRIIGEVSKNSNALKCPYCSSTNVSKIGTFNRAISIGLLGLASSKIGKTHKCNNCGSTW